MPDTGTFPITLRVNGDDRKISVASTRTLLDVLREDLHLTGTKCGCNQGVCGSCTILCDGMPIRSCLALAVTMSGREIVTIEGGQPGDALSVVQRAFVEAGAVQCGFCIPGMIMSATALLAQTPSPDDHEVREALSGNLCRCTGYVKIVGAVSLAARRLSGEGGAA